MQKNISLNDLEGVWYIQASNFPMWKNGSRKNPTFNYTIIRRNGKLALLDEVKFTRHGKIKTIRGYDTPADESQLRFIWKGKGILSLFKSRWEISWINEEKNLAVIRFSKTLFTPAGFDIIAKDNNLQDISPALEKLTAEEKSTLFYIA